MRFFAVVFGSTWFNFTFLIQHSKFRIPDSALLKAEACPVDIEYDTEDDCDHNEKQNDAYDTAAASALFSSEGFLQPVIYFADQKQLKDAGEASRIIISSIIHLSILFRNEKQGLTCFSFRFSQLSYINRQCVIGCLIDRNDFDKIVLGRGNDRIPAGRIRSVIHVNQTGLES